MATARPRAFDLREACVQAAREVIAEQGIEALSLRDVARRLGISHQAPYRHFASRDHLLAEIMQRCFADFAAHLDARPAAEDAQADLHGMGLAYLDYAARKPLEYRLMFGTPWPEPARHPDLVRHAVHAFDTLRQRLRRLHGGRAAQRARADLDALFIWSALHGLASIQQANVMQHLVLADGVERRAPSALLERIGAGLAPPQPAAPLAAGPVAGGRGRR